MSISSNIILNHYQISNKLKRLAWQVYENNMDESRIWIAGIAERGMYIANRIAHELSLISDQEICIMNLSLDAESFQVKIKTDHSVDLLENACVILVDDVLNSGKTLLNAMLPLLDRKASKIQVVVLASRSHRLYPVRADFVGISMATTLQEHLKFDNSNESDLKLILN